MASHNRLLGFALGAAGFTAFTAFAACGKSSSTSPSPSSAPSPAMAMRALAPKPDPRVGLAAGKTALAVPESARRVVTVKAAETAWNMRLVSNTPAGPKFNGVTNSDLAMLGNYVFQGSYNGYQVWDISNPRMPVAKTEFFCPASQSDVSVYKNLLFVSAEGQTGRHDCGGQGVPDTVSAIRVRGIRIFDISDVSHPRYIKDVQTCRGSHTHTVVVPNTPNPENIFVYISGSSGVRPEAELAGCSDLDPTNNPNSSQFRIEVIKVPVAHPEQADRISQPRIFQDLAAPPVNVARNAQDSVERAQQQAAAAAAGRGGRGRGGPPGGAPRVRQGPTQCHDITVYPWANLAGGACGGYGLLLDIHDPANPVRIGAAADSNYSFWHSATFSNDAAKVLFTDEWGGGSAPRCRATDKYEWGADAIYTIDASRRMHFHSYYKMPAAQTNQENCVAHNGSLIPVPGREVMVQGWYQGGVSVFDWTDADHPYEMAFFDRGPLDSDRLTSGGSWSAYWYNGVIVSSEIARGLDIFELTPSPMLTQNELDAARTVHFDYLNTQGQPHLVWPASFAKARAFVDQLNRNHGLADDRISAVRAALQSAEQASGSARSSALNTLASSLATDARSAADAGKVRMLIDAVRELAR